MRLFEKMTILRRRAQVLENTVEKTDFLISIRFSKADFETITAVECPIMFSKGNLMSLNTFLTLFWYFIHFFDPKSHFDVMNSFKTHYFGPLGPYKGKWLKNVIFHDFFKLLLGVLRWCFRYVEMFWGPLEGVLTLRIHFGPVYDSQ